MSTDAVIDLLHLIDSRDPAPADLSPVAAANLVRIRRGLELLRAQPGPGEGRRLWQQAQADAVDVSERSIRVMLSAAKSILAAQERAEILPTSILDYYLADIPKAIEAFQAGREVEVNARRAANRAERLSRWQTRAQKTLTSLDQAGTLAARLQAAEEYLLQLTAKVEALRKGKDHADAQPQLRRRDLKDLPYVLVPWRGPSMVDGQPIRVMLSCVRNTSGSRKTGDMVQLTLVRDDIDPSSALRQGADFSVCGDCPHRTGPGGLKTCYVVVPKRAVRVPWEATCGVEADLEGAVEALRRLDVPLRVGNYGNPSAMPLSVAELLIEATRDSRGRLRHTSFEHGWRTCDPLWSRFSMASVDTPEEWVEAKDLGWRTFRVKLPEEPVLPGEVVCPGAEEAGHRTQCARCLVCSGTAGRGRKDIVLDVHGEGGKPGRYRAWRENRQHAKKNSDPSSGVWLLRWRERSEP